MLKSLEYTDIKINIFKDLRGHNLLTLRKRVLFSTMNVIVYE